VGETGGAVGAEIPASEETPAAEKVEGECEVIIPADQVEVSSGDEGAPAPQDKSWKNRKR
jgi:hypothetical protein